MAELTHTERVAQAVKIGEAYATEPNTQETLEHAIECMDRLVRNHANEFYDTENAGYIWMARWQRIKRHLVKGANTHQTPTRRADMTQSKIEVEARLTFHLDDTFRSATEQAALWAELKRSHEEPIPVWVAGFKGQLRVSEGEPVHAPVNLEG